MVYSHLAGEQQLCLIVSIIMNSITHRLKRTLLYCRERPLDLILILVFLIAIIKITSLYMRVETDIDNWDEFKTEHHCVPHLSNPEVKISNWKCDDGKVYYNWRQQR